jgi:hypothetical protein
VVRTSIEIASRHFPGASITCETRDDWDRPEKKVVEIIVGVHGEFDPKEAAECYYKMISEGGEKLKDRHRNLVFHSVVSAESVPESPKG